MLTVYLNKHNRASANWDMITAKIRVFTVIWFGIDRDTEVWG